MLKSQNNAPNGQVTPTLNWYTSIRTSLLCTCLLLLALSVTAQQHEIEQPPELIIEQYSFDKKGRVEKVQLRTSENVLPQEYTVEIIDGYVIVGGDIVLGKEEDFIGNTKAAILNVSGAEWPGSVIPYTIATDYGDDQERGDNIIRYAINHIIENTNICMVPRTTEANYVEFITAGGCFSNVGMIGGKQNIGMSINCGIGAGIHEVLHAAGHWHEQSRQDRDNFVEINFDNIEADKQFNFNKYSTGADNGNYDFNSIMHYGETAFAIDRSIPTVIPKSPPVTAATNINIGQRIGLSDGDIAAINGVYTTNPSCDQLDDLPLNLRLDGLPIVARSGDDITYGNIIVANSGGEATPAAVGYVFLRNLDNGNYQFGPSFDIPALAPGATFTPGNLVYDAGSVPDGSYEPLVWVDPFGSIEEGYEQDNYYFWDNPVYAFPNVICIANRVVSSSISGNVIAANSIITDGNVTVSGNATFAAPTVILNAGFTVPAGATFSTSSTGCFASDEGVVSRSATQNDRPEIMDRVPLTTNQLLIVPNPTTGTTQLNYVLAQEENITVELYSMTGEKINSTLERGVRVAGLHQTTLDASNLNAGFYYVVLRTDNEVLTRKMMVTK